MEAPIEVAAALWNELCTHSLEAAPEECCGLVGGAPDEPFRSVYRCRNDMTKHHLADEKQFPRDGQTAFFMNETDYVRAMQYAEERGEQIRAVYHSHVGAGAYFSELDQAFATQAWFPFPDAHHVVISLVDGRVADLAAFRRTGEGFVGRRMIPRA